MMHKQESQLRTNSTIRCCRYCVPPKRHTACWDHCPEYLKEKAEYEAIKAEHRKKEKIEIELNAQKYASIHRSRKGGK